MPRRAARWVVAAGVTSAAIVAGAALPPIGQSLSTDPSALTLVAAHTSPATSFPDPSRAVAAGELRKARTTYENRALLARTDSLDLAPVVDGVDGVDRPNVLVLMTDDMRADDLKFMPHARRLIGDAGATFTNALAPHPLCCPSRASFLTGRYSHNHGVWSHVAPFGFPVLDDGATLPVWLQRAGYRTAFLGKYLNAYGERPLPDGRPSLRYVPPGWTDWRASVDAVESPEEKGGPLEGSTYRYFDTTLNVNGRLEPYEGPYQTHLLSRVAQDIIRREARQPAPYFAWVSFTAPHTGTPFEPDDPLPVTAEDGVRQKLRNPARPDYVKGRFDQQIVRGPGGEDPLDRIEDKPVHVRQRAPLSAAEEAALLENYRQRAEALSVVDDEIANMMRVLEATGELDNTYVLFTSDNGFFLGEHRRRQGKTLAYDPALRVPLLMRGPGIAAGETRTDPFLTLDIAPTVLDAVGARAPHELDGVSLLDVARDGDRGWLRGVLTDTGPIGVRSELLRIREPVRVGRSTRELRVTSGVRTGHWLYLETATGERELYDLRGDPHQRVNLVDRPAVAHTVDLLARELDRLRECRGSGCSAPLPQPLRTDAPAPPAFPATTLAERATLPR